jgi:eukaryotic-like serine/threonine-protein kinase
MLTSGSKLGPFEIRTWLGSGGMGDVYRAYDSRLRRDVAIKVLPDKFARDLGRLRRFEHEARAVNALNHPNILSIFDIGSHEGSRYVVFELLDGQTLREALDGKAVPVKDSINYAVQIANGLAAAHEKGIIHRDIKPENILIARDGRVKILDFGLAKLTEAENLDGDMQLTLASQSNPTDPGVVLGTVGYMSPEQVRGQNVDQRSDIFSLGAVIYEMISGTRAFCRDSSVETLNAILNEDPADLRQHSNVSPAINRLIRRCLEKQAERRFHSAADLAFALETIEESRVRRSDLVKQEGQTASSRGGRGSRSAIRTIILGTALLVTFAAGVRWGKPPEIFPTEWQAERLGGPPVAWGPRVSPDGKLLAFQALLNGITQVGIMTPESGDWSLQSHDRTHGPITELCWSMDGSRVFYDRFFEQPLGIFSVPAVGIGDERLVLDGAVWPQALPDGSLLVTKMIGGAKQLYRFWPETQQLEPLNALPSRRLLDPAVRTLPGGREVVFFGKPNNSTVADHLYVLDITSGRTRRIAPDAVFTPDWIFPLAVTQDGNWVVFDLPSGDLHHIVASAVDGSSAIHSIATLTSLPMYLDIAMDGSIYVDQADQPQELLRFSAYDQRLERFLLPAGVRFVLPLPDGHVLTSQRAAGRNRLMLLTPGGDAKPFIQTQEETDFPATLLGNDRLVFTQGKGASRAVAVATLDGRVLRKFTHLSGDIEELAGSPDGRTLFYSIEDEVWSIPAEDGEAKRIRRGNAVAIDPNGQYLIIETAEQGGVQLIRVPLDGGPEEPIRITSDVRINQGGRTLGSNGVAKDGRIGVRIGSKESWFGPAGILDPRTGRIDVIPPGFDFDMSYPAWDDNGRLLTIGHPTRSSLWRFRPVKSAPKR